MEFAVVILISLLLVAILIAAPAALIIALLLWQRVTNLTSRLNDLVQQREVVLPEPEIADTVVAPTMIADVVEESIPPSAPISMPSEGTLESIQWEYLIGRKGLGWIAVLLLFFGTGFFLKYAFDNDWIGPIGQVGLGLMAGVALVAAGWRYHERGWRIFSQMLTSAGIVLLYLATYSAFGFYNLVPQHFAVVFLLFIITEAALLAVLYNAQSLAHMSLIGGLLTPLIMQSEVDQYRELFTYLALLDAGIVLLVLWRRWRGLGMLALLGSQALFWLWYVENYHPEKLWWALGFQLVVYGLFVGQRLFAHVLKPRRAEWEDAVRLLLNAALWFTAAYVLLKPDCEIWLGTLAVVMAAMYIGFAHLMLSLRGEDGRQMLTSLAAAVGFVVLAFPIQADAQWVALGWAAVGAVLYWFGLRIKVVTLRVMAVTLGILAAIRVVFIDSPPQMNEVFWPVLNKYTLPALGVCVCVLGSITLASRFISQLTRAEKILISIAIVCGLLLMWYVLSMDTYASFRRWAALDLEQATRWRWFGQMALSALWAVYAAAVLAVGFWRKLALLRWTALCLFAATILKVFFHDMADLREIYRILAFFVVALLLGAAGWAYHRIQLEIHPTRAIHHEGN